jgi:hypothetical protein
VSNEMLASYTDEDDGLWELFRPEDGGEPFVRYTSKTEAADNPAHYELEAFTVHRKGRPEYRELMRQAQRRWVRPADGGSDA